MSSGTSIIQAALQKIGAHSVINPAPSESIALGVDVLNSMISQWQDESIDMGCVPLSEAGSELSEPLGARNAIISNLAVMLQPEFPGTNVSPELSRQARKGYNHIQRVWRSVTIPKRKVRETLPRGAGNKTYLGSAFFDAGEDLA